MAQLVLFATAWSAQSGGINAVNYDLGIALARIKGLQIHCVICDSDAQTLANPSENVKLLTAPDTLKNSHKWLKKFLQDNFQDQAEELIWIGHDAITGGLALMAKELCGGTSLVLHHMDYSNYYHLKNKDGLEKIGIQKHIIKNAEIVFAVGPRLLVNAKRLRGINKQTYSLDLGRPEFSASSNKILDYRFAICGRISVEEEPVKNISAAVRATASILANLESNRGSISLIGSNDAQIKKSIELQSRAVAINEIPYLSNRKSYFSELIDCDVLIMPSVKEGFGLVAWEAACLGIPILITRASGFFQWLAENSHDKLVSSVNVIAMPTIDEAKIKNELEKLLLDYPAKKQDALRLAKILEEKTWDASAHKFAALACNLQEDHATKPSNIEKPLALPTPAKKIERPRQNILDRETVSGFERFEDLLSLNYKRRSLVISRAESTDYSKNQRIKFELWKGFSPNKEEFFLYLTPNSSITQSVKRLAQVMASKKIAPLSICVIRKEKGDIEYLRKIFRSNKIEVELTDYSVREYLWDYCIDNAFKESTTTDEPINYVDQPLYDDELPDEGIMESARTSLIEMLCLPPRYSAVLIVAAGGMGKTWLCMSLANELPKKMTSEGLVILIQAEGIREYLTEEGFPDIRIRNLYDLYELYGSSISLERSYDRFTFELAVLAGNIVVLIDGLDELATILQERFELTAFLNSLRELSLGLGSSQVLLTTRDNLLVEEGDIGVYGIKKFDLLGFSPQALTRYSAKRFRGRRNAIELGTRLNRTVTQAGLGDSENRVIPFLADVVCNILEEEADKKEDPSFDLIKDLSPYASNNETIDRIIHSVFRREIRRQDIEINISDLVISLSELISEHGERVGVETLKDYLGIFYDKRAPDIFKKILLNPLFRAEETGLRLKYDFLQSYFRAIYVIDCLNNDNMSSPVAINALAKVNAHGCPELDYLKKYYIHNPEKIKEIADRLIPVLKIAVRKKGSEKNGELRLIDANCKAMSALLKIYSSALNLGGQRLSEKLAELFADNSSPGRCIDALCLYGEFPPLDFSGFIVSNSIFSEFKKFPLSKVGGAKFRYCTFEKCHDGGFVDESFSSAEFDQTCVLGDIGTVLQTAKQKLDLTQRTIEEDALSFVKSFFKRGHAYDPKKAWISFSTRVEGLKSQNFEKLIPEFVVIKNEKADETYYRLEPAFVNSVRNFIDNNQRDNRIRIFLAMLAN